MPASSETLLSANSHPDGSTLTTLTGEEFKGDGFYGRSDGFHTVQYNLQDFVGTVKIQASLATEPADSDWFDVEGTTHTSPTPAHANADGSFYYNFLGNFVYVRARVLFTDGTVNSIRMNH